MEDVREKVNGIIREAEKANRVMDYTLRHYGTSCIAFAELYKQGEITDKELYKKFRDGSWAMDIYVANGYAEYEDGSYKLTDDGRDFGSKLCKMIEILTS